MEEHDQSISSSERKVLTSLPFLQREWEVEDKHEALTLFLLESGNMGVRVPQIFNHIGAALSLLTQIASCFWGCKKGDHIIENLVRRYTNYALGAMRLALLGLYDEALGLIRGMAEIANLLQLFELDNNQVTVWKQLPPKKRKTEFGPAKVRIAIEAKSQKPIVDADTYSKFCELGIHVTPTSAYLSHQFENNVYIGGAFSIPGLFLVLSELASIIAPCLTSVGKLSVASDHLPEQLEQVKQELLEAVSFLRITNYESYLDGFRDDDFAQKYKDVASKITEQEENSLYEKAVQELVDEGTIRNIDEMPDEEKKQMVEMVFERARGILANRVQQESREEMERWIDETGEIAVAYMLQKQLSKYKKGE